MQCKNVEILNILHFYKPGWAAASRFGHSDTCPRGTWLFTLAPFLGDALKWEPFLWRWYYWKRCFIWYVWEFISIDSKDFKRIWWSWTKFDKIILIYVLSGSAVFWNRCTVFHVHAYHTPMEKTDAQFFGIFLQFFKADALFYAADVQFNIKLVYFNRVFRNLLPNIYISS